MRRRGVVIGAVLVALVLGVAALGRWAVRVLRAEVVAALGPGATIGGFDLGLRRLGVRDVVLPGPSRWPADAALRTARVTITPELRSIFTSTVGLADVDVVDPYVSIVRTRNGRLRVVPNLLEPASDAPDAESRPRGPTARPRAPSRAPSTEASRAVRLDRLRISDGRIEFYDASVARPPWPIRLVGVDARVESLTVPPAAGRTPLDVRATIDGPARDGTVELSGWVEPATREMDLTARLRGVDVMAFRPYVARGSTKGLAGGAFDLDLHATVRGGHLTAPGRLVLSDLAFSAGGRGTDRVLGVPRDLLAAALARHGRIAFDFRLEGNVDDPRFSLNDTLAVQIAAGVLQEIGGLSVPGLVGGVGALGSGTLQGADKVQQGIGAAVKGLFRRR